MQTGKLIKIRVGDKAKQIITETADALDMKEIGVASRIYEWFARQDATMQRHVLQLLPPGMDADILRLALERAEKKRK